VGVLFMGCNQLLAGSIGTQDLLAHMFGWLAFINLLLAAFNLLPGPPLDGGVVLAALLWMQSRDQTKAQSAAAIEPSGAKPLPQCARAMLHPISVPGHPSGCHGPNLPTHSPVAFSTTEKNPKPCRCHPPITVAKPRQATGRTWVPPM
jgi:membrane-associated protease RseP (regulator of RpoE activity)